jgi:hypothetical protein
MKSEFNNLEGQSNPDVASGLGLCIAAGETKRMPVHSAKFVSRAVQVVLL